MALTTQQLTTLRAAVFATPAAAADAQGANSLLLAAMIALLEDED